MLLWAVWIKEEVCAAENSPPDVAAVAESAAQMGESSGWRAELRWWLHH